MATYVPCWTDGRDGMLGRLAGPDEDAVTMAVAAGRAALDGGETKRVVVVGRQVGSIAAEGRAVIARALDLPSDAIVETFAGGPSSAVDAMLGSPAGTLVITVEIGRTPSAAAVLTKPGAGVAPAGRVEHGLPISVSQGRHDDPRFLRERAWRPSVKALTADFAGHVAIAGVPKRTAKEIFNQPSRVESPEVDGAPAPFFAAAAMLNADLTGRVIALDGGSGAAFDILELDWPLTEVRRSATVPLPGPPAVAADIAISLSAYERAFESKVGLKASRCSCGEMSLPPRRYCLNCGRQDDTNLVALPHSGEVYSMVTIRVPIPGLRGPYSLAIVAIDGTALRLLAPVTDAWAGSAAIGDSGELVLRKLADRQGIADYGYAFVPAEKAAG